MLQEQVQVKPEGVDPETNNATEQDQMIACAPIVDAAGNYTPTYLSDWTTVWEKLIEITHDQDCHTYVRPGKAAQDGV